MNEVKEAIELRKFVAELVLKERVYTDKSIGTAIADMATLLHWIVYNKIV